PCAGPHARVSLVDADPDVQVEPFVLLVQLGDPPPDRERRPDRALGIVLVRLRRAEQGEDGVAAELLERAAVTLEVGAHTRVTRRDERLHVLGIEALGARRRADEVDEDRGDHLALLAGGGRRRYLRERGTTGEAELRLVGVLGSALGAERHAESVRPGRGGVL